MAKSGFSFLDTMFHRRAIRRWARAARKAPGMPLDVLREQRTGARALRAHLDRVMHVADERLALPSITSTGFAIPHNADWAWRPELWRGALPHIGMSSAPSKSMLGSEVTLFHDCALSEVTLRQVRNRRAEDLAPYGLRMEVFKFDGSFLSLVIDLPQGAVDGLKRTHLVRMDTLIDLENPIEIFARLNIKHGPNTEQIVRELPLHERDVMVEFDIAYSNLNEKRVEKAWVDLIFERPEMNQVTLRDVTFSRRPRAAL